MLAFIFRVTDRKWRVDGDAMATPVGPSNITVDDMFVRVDSVRYRVDSTFVSADVIATKPTGTNFETRATGSSGITRATGGPAVAGR